MSPFMDFHNLIMVLHNWILKFHGWIIKVPNNYWIVEFNKWFMDFIPKFSKEKHQFLQDVSSKSNTIVCFICMIIKRY